MDSEIIAGVGRVNVQATSALNVGRGSLRAGKDALLNSMRESQRNIRNDYKLFLQQSLSILDQDIIDRIINVYDVHSAREDDVVTANLLMIQDLTERSHLPFVRNFRNLVNESVKYSSRECAEVVARQHEAPLMTPNSQLIQCGVGNEEPTWREGDLQLIGALNDLVTWGQRFRQEVLNRYRDHIEKEDKQATVSVNVGLEPLSGFRKDGRNSAGVSPALGKVRVKKRPATAGAVRSPARRPPVGGGFRSEPVEGLDLAFQSNGRLANTRIGTGFTQGDGRKGPQVLKRASVLRNKSRVMMKNALGSYYNFEDAKGGGDMMDAYNAAVEQRRRNVKNAFKPSAKTLRRKINSERDSLAHEDPTRELRRERSRERRPMSAGGGSRPVHSNLMQMHGQHSRRPRSAQLRERSPAPKPFNIPRNAPVATPIKTPLDMVSGVHVLNSLGVSPMPEYDIDPPPMEVKVEEEKNDLHVGVPANKSSSVSSKTPKGKLSKGSMDRHRKRTVEDVRSLKKTVISPWGEEDGEYANHDILGLTASAGVAMTPDSRAQSRPGSAKKGKVSSNSDIRPKSASMIRGGRDSEHFSVVGMGMQ